MYSSVCYLDKLRKDFSIENLQLETQNKEYEGATFYIDNISFRSRLAKLTPKKKGYFVAFWEKDSNGSNKPFSYSESPENLIIVILEEQLSGYFVFPKDVLLNKGILKGTNSKGKMAIRVYPSWEQNLNKTASMTQKWQTKYFTNTSNNKDSF